MKITLPENTRLKFEDLKDGDWFCFEEELANGVKVRQKIEEHVYAKYTVSGSFSLLSLSDAQITEDANVRKLEVELKVIGYA
jgi:hypothetical protein